MTEKEEQQRYDQALMDDDVECMCWQEDCPICAKDAPCTYCGGDGYGIVGTDWDSDDYINGPYDGQIQRCPNCHGTGKAKDMTFW